MKILRNLINIASFVVLFCYSMEASAKQHASQEHKDIHDHAVSIAGQNVDPKAINYLLQKIDEQSTAGAPWLWRAVVQIYASADDKNGLLQVLDDPKYIGKGVYFALSYFYFLEGNHDLAWQTINKLEKNVFDQALVLNLAGAIESNRQHFHEAFSLIERALKKDPAFSYAQNNLLMTWARMSLIELEKLPNKSRASIDSLVSKLTLDFASHTPFNELFIESFKLTEDSNWAVIAVEINKNGLLLVEAPDSKSHAIHFYMIDRDEPRWHLITNYAKQILLLERTVITGSHHAQDVYFHIDRKGRINDIKHEWQHVEAIRHEDLDNDGIPELILDFSNYYVGSYAEGIVDPNYSILRYHAQDGTFRDSPLQIELPDLPITVQEINAKAIGSAYRGDWSSAISLLAEVMTSSNSKSLKLNYQFVDYHAKFFSHKRSGKRKIDSILFGETDESALPTSKADWSQMDTKTSLMRMFDLLLRHEYEPEKYHKLLSEYFVYKQQKSLDSNNNSSFLQRDKTKYIWPEVRALQHAAMSYVKEHLVYTLPGTDYSTLSKILAIDDTDTSRNYQFNVDKNNLDNDFEVLYDFGSAFDRIMDSRIDEYIESNNTEHINAAMIVNRLYSFLLRGDYARAEKLLKIAENLIAEDEGAKAHLQRVHRLIDMRYGRYYQVADAIRASDQDELTELASVEAFEHLGLFSLAEDMYTKALNSVATFTPSSLQVSDPGLAFEASVGIARTQLKRGALKDAELGFWFSLNLLHDNLIIPTFYRNYSEAVLGMTTALIKQRKVLAAYAYNGLGYSAANRMKPGSGWMQGASQHNLEVLTKVFFNDFLISAERGKHSLATAYLAAAISLSLDQYNLSKDKANKRGINEVAHNIYREGVSYYVQNKQYQEAFSLLNSVKQTSELQYLVQNSGNKIHKLTLANFAKLRKTAKQTNATIIQFMVSENVLTTFIIDINGDLHVLQQAITRQTLKLKINELLDSTLELGVGNQFDKFERASQSLFNDVVSPVIPFLNKNEPIIILPDRELHQVPFGMLMNNKKRFLIQDYTISYATSLNTVKQQSRRKSLDDTVLIIHSPNNSNYAELPHTATEAASISNLFDRTNIKELSKQKANRKNVIKQARTASIIHFATHSVADMFSPEESLIALSDMGKKGISENNQNITLRDMLDGTLLFHNASLVVLSSCESANGKIYEEGNSSLALGLMVAGASSALVTKWEVVDESSPQFMEVFYKHYQQKDSAPYALRQAQLRAIEAGLHPQVWAPYIVFTKLGEFNEQ